MLNLTQNVNLASNSNSNLNIIPKYDTQIKSYSALEQIKKHLPHILENRYDNNINQELLKLENDQNEIKIVNQFEFKNQYVHQKLSAPCLQLTGHLGELFSSKFSTNGKYLASCGQDKQILLWDVFNQCRNIVALKGHTNVILDLQWSQDSSRIFTASADKSISIWDMEEYKRIKKIKGHSSFVNSCHSTRRGIEMLVSGSDDCTMKLWDTRVRGKVQEYVDSYQITSVSFNDTNDKIFIGGIDNQIKVYDIRKQEIEYNLMGHTDTITSLSLSPDGNFLLSNSMDQTIRMWDVRPFVIGNRCQKIFQGSSHSFEKNLIKCGWSGDQTLITSGSSDKFTYIWDANSRKILHKLAGHQGSVNETCFHPFEKIIASCSSDRSIIIGEIPEVTL